MLRMVRKIYAGILVYRVCRVTGDLVDDEQGGCIDEIFTLKQIGEKPQEKNVEHIWVLWIWSRLYREALW